MSEWPVDDDSKSRMTDYGSHKTSLDTSTPSVPPQPPPPMAPTTHFEQVLTSSQQQAQQSSMNLYKRIYNSARQLTHHRNRQSDDPKPKSGRHCILSELLQSTSSSFKSNLEVKVLHSCLGFPRCLLFIKCLVFTFLLNPPVFSFSEIIPTINTCK